MRKIVLSMQSIILLFGVMTHFFHEKMLNNELIFLDIKDFNFTWKGRNSRFHSYVKAEIHKARNPLFAQESFSSCLCKERIPQ